MDLSTAPLSRRDRERLVRRREMLDAALAVFSEKGYDGTTVDEVAERAEFGKGTIYNYFPGGKDELYFSIFEEIVVEGLLGVIRERAPGPEAVQTRAGVRDGFRRLIAGLIEHFLANRAVLLLFMKEGHRMMMEPTVMARVAERFSEIIDAFAAPVEAAVASGVLRSLPPRPVAHLIMGNVRGYLMAHVDADCDPTGATERPDVGTPDEAAAFITTILFDGLLAPEA